jgi:nicotinate-nucleotide adenylyltransferase
MRRIGILGGAFNPPHQGHLRLAELALQHLGLACVRFIPTAQSPHKPAVGPSGEARLALLRAALEATGQPFEADPIEVERGGRSYTADTLEALHQREPGTTWILLLGSDQLPGLPSWRNLSRILELASLAVAPRPGWEAEAIPGLEARLRASWSGSPGEVVWLPGTELDLASRTLREALAQGRILEGLPIQVRDAIQRQNLYR